jgi:hypothetical protein
MIETLFARADLVIRLQQPPLGSHMEDLAVSLKQQNYSGNTIRCGFRGMSISVPN